ncbi:ETEC_3214 domain-containing protein [Pollutimonas bauzanensis]|uniref:Uncharacterized protein n=1 Tax=Pollutimonas bauzanensis TaxID=658167 RepID=A0A1M5XA45_9BURK|nr:ETEC_3214 domain-containing protein [Pollutimonas bauzanensis]SHH96404.1 hypothetical protein SAMN04488135_106240 [Pollutimonas bauzanensis]
MHQIPSSSSNSEKSESKHSGRWWLNRLGGGGIALVLWLAFTQAIPAVQPAMQLYQELLGWFQRDSKSSNPTSVANTESPSISVEPPANSDISKKDASVRHVRSLSISNGTTREYIVEMLGPPVARQDCGTAQAASEIYSFPDRYLQLVYDAKNILRFYSITLRSHEADVEIPVLNRRLGGFAFLGLEKDLSDGFVLAHYLGSKYFEYSEGYYLANPGNYRTLYLGVHAAGADLTPGCVDVVFPDSDEDRMRVRRNYPNTFGLGGGLVGPSLDNLVEDCGLGVEYFSTRNLPDNQTVVTFAKDAFG